MSYKLSLVALGLLACSSAWADNAEFSASLAELRDSHSDNSLDLDAIYSPLNAPWLQLGAGVGAERTTSLAGDLNGPSWRALADVHSGHFELRAYYRDWDAQGYQTDTEGARASYHLGGATFTAIGERRGFDVDYNGGTDTAPQESTASFSETGWGGGASYKGAGWGIYGESVFYHSHALTQYVPEQDTLDGSSTSTPPLSGLPGIPGTPNTPLTPVLSNLPSLSQAFTTLIPSLSGSLLTVADGALKHLFTAGAEVDFGKSALHADWTGAEDAIFGIISNSYSIGYRLALTSMLNAGVTVGTTRSSIGSTNFGGLSVAASW